MRWREARSFSAKDSGASGAGMRSGWRSDHTIV